MSLQYSGSVLLIPQKFVEADGKYISNHANSCVCVCVCWVLGCSMHCHARGSCDQEAGVEQRRETCALLHAGHPDL